MRGRFIHLVVGALGLVAILLVAMVVSTIVASSMGVSTTIRESEDEVQRSIRLSKEAAEYFKALDREREWRRREIEKIKREQGLK